MQQIKVSVPGKIHLMGEHTVVYGKPALLAAVNRRLEISLKLHNDQNIKLVNRDSRDLVTVSLNQIEEKVRLVREDWENYHSTGKSILLKKHIGNSSDLAMIAIGETFAYHQKKIPSGFSLEYSSQIPVGSGMGSSAALAVGIAGAISSYFGFPPDIEAINNIAYIIEQRQHGKPSGGDNSTVAFGGLIWFRKETPAIKTIGKIPLIIPSDISNNLYLLQTGKPEETTGEMLAIVAAFAKSNPVQFEKILNSQEEITRKIATVIENWDEKEFTLLLIKGQRNLEKLGVVSKKTLQLIRAIEQSGGFAKICGAGGYSQNSGIILAYHPNKSELAKACKPFGIQAEAISFEQEGFKIEAIEK